MRKTSENKFEVFQTLIWCLSFFALLLMPSIGNAAWTSPTEAPPSGNVAPPIFASSTNLQIIGADGDGGSLKLLNTGSTASAMLQIESLTNASPWTIFSMQDSADGQGDLHIRYGTGDEILTIDQSGNVGIGSTTPGATFGVQGGAIISTTLNVGGESSFGDAVDLKENLILNIGNELTDFTAGGGLNLAGNLGVTGTLNVVSDSTLASTTASILTITDSFTVTDANSTSTIENDLWIKRGLKIGPSSVYITQNGIDFTQEASITTQAGDYNLAPAGSVNINIPNNENFVVNDYAGAPILYIDSGTGKVGIGTTTEPEYPIDLIDDGSTAIINVQDTNGSLWTGLRMERSGEKWFMGMPNDSNKLLLRSDGVTNDVVIDESGRVGIGTSSPSAILTVGNNDQFTVTNSGNIDATALTMDNALLVNQGGTGWRSFNAGSVLFGNAGSSIATSSSLYWDNSNSRLGIASTSPNYPVSYSDKFWIDSSGNVTATKFVGAIDINGNLDMENNWIINIGSDGTDFSPTGGLTLADPLIVSEVAGTSTFAGGMTVDTDTLVVDYSSNKVGIGTNAPEEELHVSGDLKVTGTSYFSTASTSDLVVDGNTTLNGLNANRLMYINGSSQITSTDAVDWISSTTNQIIVVNDLDGTITLSTPQDIHSGATPTFASSTFTNFAAGSVPFFASGGALDQDSTNFSWDNSTNRLTVENLTVNQTSNLGQVEISADVIKYNTASTTAIGEAMHFLTDSSERLTILAGGNVGVSSTSPSELLSIGDNAYITDSGGARFAGNVDTNGGLDVTGGNLTLDSNDLIINGTEFIVDGATGNTTINGDVTVGGHILNSSASSYNVGASASRFAEVYGDSYYANVVDFNNGPTDDAIMLKDNEGDALKIMNGASTFMKFDTSNSSEELTIKYGTILQDTLNVSATSTLNGIIIDANKFIVNDGTGDTSIAGTLNVDSTAHFDGTIDTDNDLIVDGNAGIGTTTTDAKLAVLSTTNNQWSGKFVADDSSGASYGLKAQGGTNQNDVSFEVTEVTGSPSYFSIRGDGYITTDKSIVIGNDVGRNSGAGVSGELRWFNDDLSINNGSQWLAITGTWKEGSNNSVYYEEGGVGIGSTTDPMNLLDIEFDKTLAVSSSTLHSNSIEGLRIANVDSSVNNGAALYFENANGFGKTAIAHKQNGGVLNSADLLFFTEDLGDFEERMRIESDGKVGIGTDSPGSLFQVGSLFNVTDLGVMTTASGTIGNINIFENSVLATNNSGLKMYDNAGNGITLLDGGNLGIGSTTPNSLLAVGDNFSVTSDGLTTTENLFTNATTTTGHLVVTGNSVFNNSLDDIKYLTDGSIVEDVSVVATSTDGSTVTLTLEKQGGGDLTALFDGLEYTVDSTPATSTSLIAGSDTSPQINYVYINDNRNLAVSTTGFPVAEQHVPIAEVMVQGASSVQADGVYSLHKWGDHLANGNGGHMGHVNEWIRSQHATWQSGVEPSYQEVNEVNGGYYSDIEVKVTGGVVKMLHDHDFPASNFGDEMYVVNHPDGAYTKITDLTEITKISTGDTINNRKRYSLVFWGVVNEKTDESKLFINLPGGTYDRSSDVIEDPMGYANYNIPQDYVGEGFMIAKINLRYRSGPNRWRVENDEIISLLGQLPSIFAGGTAGQSTEFSDTDFLIYDTDDSEKGASFETSGITVSTIRTITIPDKDGTLAVISDVEDITNFDLTDGYFMVGDAANKATSTNNIFFDNNNSRVGIGTTTPNKLLSVVGDLEVTGCFGPVYSATSTSAYNGGAATDYATANGYCSTGSHVCSEAELMNSLACGTNLPSSGSYWINAGSTSDEANDCSGWNTSSSNNYGTFWNFSSGNSMITVCSNSIPYACCK